MGKFKFEKQFRDENPQTVGETDGYFDLGNYNEWLENKAEKLLSEFYKIEIAPPPYNEHENNVFVFETKAIARNANKILNYLDFV